MKRLWRRLITASRRPSQESDQQVSSSGSVTPAEEAISLDLHLSERQTPDPPTAEAAEVSSQSQPEEQSGSEEQDVTDSPVEFPRSSTSTGGQRSSVRSVTFQARREPSPSEVDRSQQDQQAAGSSEQAESTASAAAHDPYAEERAKIIQPEEDMLFGTGERFGEQSPSNFAYDSEEEIHAEINFFQGVCLMCKSSPDMGTSHYQCSVCLAVRYCSKEHQRAHWNKHRKICKTLVKPNGVSIFACGAQMKTKKTWKTYLEQAQREVEKTLQRALTYEEAGIFQHPPVCRLCHSMENLRECARCYMVQYCSVDHAIRDEIDHDHQCYNFSQALLCDRYLSHCEQSGTLPTYPRILPKISEAYSPLTENIRTILAKQIIESDATGRAAEIFRRAEKCNKNSRMMARLLWMTETLTYPLTVLYALQEMELKEPICSKESLLIHVMKIYSPIDCWMYNRWEYLLHILPHMKSIVVDMYNFEQDCKDDFLSRINQRKQLCEECTAAGRSIEIRAHDKTYASVLKNKEEFSVPDILLTCDDSLTEDCGSGTWQGPLVEAAVPILITSCSMEVLNIEMQWLASCLKFTIAALLKPHSNPFRSCHPLVTKYHSDGAYFLNRFICVLRLLSIETGVSRNFIVPYTRITEEEHVTTESSAS